MALKLDTAEARVAELTVRRTTRRAASSVVLPTAHSGWTRMLRLRVCGQARLTSQEQAHERALTAVRAEFGEAREQWESEKGVLDARVRSSQQSAEQAASNAAAATAKASAVPVPHR